MSQTSIEDLGYSLNKLNVSRLTFEKQPIVQENCHNSHTKCQCVFHCQEWCIKQRSVV